MKEPKPVVRTRRRVAALAAVLLLLCGLPGPPLFAQGADAQPPPWLRAVNAWLAAVHAHQPGLADAAIGVTIGSGLVDLEEILQDVLALARALGNREGSAKPIEFKGVRLSTAQLRTLLGVKEGEGAREGTNRLLRRAAVYHADVALAGSGRNGASSPKPAGQPSLLIADGQPVQKASSSVHWAFGRQLLDHLQPGPSKDPLARAWYNATASALQALHLLSEADEHLEQARQIFPDDAEILFRGACAIEAFTSPSIQAALGAETKLDLAVPGTRLAREVRQRPSVRSLLDRAEDLFRRALERDPSLLEARIRLARLIAIKGHHAEALELLDRPLPAALADPLRYLALMLLADEEQAAGRRSEARAHYAAAAELFPTAQSPPLALGLLAREAGDRAAAAAALDRLSRLPADPGDRVDPWWVYYLMQGADAGPLRRSLYALLAEDDR